MTRGLTRWIVAASAGAALAFASVDSAGAQACPPESNVCIGPMPPLGPAIGAVASFGQPVSPLMALVYEKISDKEREEREAALPGASSYAEEAAERRADRNAARALDALFGKDDGSDVIEGRNADVATSPLSESVPSLFWVRGAARVGSSTATDGSPAADLHGGAAFVGVDLPYDAYTRFGVAAGYSRSFVESYGGRSELEADGYHASIYASHANGAWRMRAVATYAYYDLSSSRDLEPTPGRLETARADYSANNIEALAEISYVFAYGRWALEPYATLGISWLDTDAYQEHGADPASLATVQGHSETWPYSILGGRLSTQFELAGALVSPSLDLGWRHVYGDATPELVYAMSDASFAISGIPIAEDSLLVGLGLDTIMPSTGWRTSLKYIGEIAEGAQLHTFSAGIAIPF